MRLDDRIVGLPAGVGKILRPLLLLLLLVTTVTPAAAQPAVQDKAALEAKKEALFQQMLRDPANLDTTFAYADIATRLGDYEGAVSALQRMLLFNPDLPRVDLELGALYFRMGAFALARDYFEKAAAAKPPPAVRANIDRYLVQISTAEKRWHIHGYFYSGVQYQSDANVAPGSGQILTPIFPFPLSLNGQFVKRTDRNLFATASILYSYDLGTQNRDSFDITTLGFMNHYFRFDRLDLDMGEITAGPRFNFPNLGRYAKRASVKPYAIFDEVGLGEHQYFLAYGAGIEYDEIVWKDLAIKSVFEFRQKKFSNSPDRPVSYGLDGNDKSVSISLTKPITKDSALTFQFDFLDQDTKFAFYSNKSYTFSGAYRIRYDDPLGIAHIPWESTIFVSRVFDNYGAPDPCCNTSGNPFQTGRVTSDRYDRRWRFGLTEAVPVSESTALVLQLSRDIVSSNLPLYRYTSDSLIVGPQIRF